MPTAPTNTIVGTDPTGGSTKKYSEYNLFVLLGDDDGTDIELLNGSVVDYLVPIQLTQKLGSKGLDKCTFAYDLAKDDKRVLDLKVPTTFGRQIEIRKFVGNSVDNILGWETIFWGELSTQTISVDKEERSVIEASIRPYHFGTLITGERQWNEIASTPTTKDGYITFNPMIDGKIEFNMSNKTVTPGGDTEKDWKLWLDIESVRTSLALTANALTGIDAEWSLGDIIKTLCWWCNPDEDFIQNPNDTVINAAFDSTTDPKIKNLRLKPGKYLNEYLDQILHPHGYDWCIYSSYDNETDFKTKRYFLFYRKGDGPKHNLKFQRPGKVLNDTESTVNHFRVDYDVNSLANHIIVQGSHREKEGSFILYPCWRNIYDNLFDHDLDKTDPDSQYNTYTSVAGIKNAWRLWAFNEGGDYSALRPNPQLREIPTTATSLTNFFGDPAIPRRRKPSKPLLLDDDGKRVDYTIHLTQDFDTSPGDGSSSTWTPYKEVIGDITFQVLRDQIGILFTANTPPWYLMNAGIEKAGVKLTCCIRSDARITGTATRQNSSPQLRDIKHFIDKSDSFHLREVQNTGDHTSELYDASASTDEIDDSTGVNTITTYAEKIRDDFDSAEIRTKFKMVGIHLEPDRFSLVEKIEGRNISLNRNTDDVGVTKKYLQVTGRMISFQQPILTTLTVEKPRER